ncbi:tail fiber assembly protein [Enterobacter asburiae]|uniref:tail fiber assembly protein n=1 Tax=Enterobacter asburiae TaxID=61645 RepID=UPI0034D1EA81
MSNYVYSATTNAFYPISLKSDYEAAGSWPKDGKEVDEDCFLEFTSVGHADKYRVAGEDGLPAWEPVPAPTKEQLIAIADAEKMRLVGLANANINVKQWPGKAAIGRLKGDELAQYNLWLDYLDALDAVDTSSAPNINWPESPVKS